MKYKKLSSEGFHLIELLIILLVIAAIGFVGFKVFNNKNKTDNSMNNNSSSTEDGSVEWRFNEQTNEYYAIGGTPPACKDPFKLDVTPVDLSLVNVIGMPGAYRGFSYKPHGGFKTDNSPDGHMEVKMPMDATLVGINRYYEGDPAELQYLLTFESDCGIAFRFDHLYKLTPAFQALAETTAEPKLNDTRTDPNRPFERTKFKAGDVVATEVGFPRVKNFGFDFGVYDFRKRNEISQNEEWAAIHNQYQSLEWFGVCWLDMFQGNDATKAKQLAAVVLNPAKPLANKISDYCPEAEYSTLDFNNGQPTGE